MELKALHFTDLHEDANRLAAIAKIVEKEEVDVTYFTGDFIGKQRNGHSTAKIGLEDRIQKNFHALQNSKTSKKLQEFIQRNKIDKIETIEDIPSYLRAEFEKLYKEQYTEMQKATGGAVVESYQALRPGLEKIASKSKLVGVLGNHDLQIGYKLLGDIVDFADIKEEVTVTGNTGKEFRIKGAINSYEMPQIYGAPELQETLGPYFINYLEGYSSKIPELKKNPKMLEAVVKTQESLSKRLNSTGDADILLLHKNNPEYGSGDAVSEYLPKVGHTCSGHFHAPVIEVMAGGRYNTNSGTDHTFVYEYDADKKVSNIKIYKLHKDAADIEVIAPPDEIKKGEVVSLLKYK